MEHGTYFKKAVLAVDLIAVELGYTPEPFSKQKEWEELNKLKIEYNEKLEKEAEELIILHFKSKYGMTPEQVVQNYIIETNKLCYVGGYGYWFHYKGISGVYTGKHMRTDWCPHHWVVKPENYELAKPTTDQLMALHYYSRKNIDFQCILSDVAEQETWGN